METGLQAVNQQRKLSEWAERVSACRSSGLSIKTWCRENGVSEQAYYKWQRRLYITFGIPKRTIEKISVPELFHQRIQNTLDWIVENERIRKEWDEVVQDKETYK